MSISYATCIGDIAGEDIIDTRDLESLLTELETRADDEDDELDDGETALLDFLKGLRDEISEWSYGETLIADSHFETYAKELADDIGAINSDATWPNNCIDWERAARELQVDYSCTEIGSVTYWFRDC
jgi:hypothetical protein